MPLLNGGFAFGYGVAEIDGFHVVDILDTTADTPSPPANIATLPIAIKDLLIGSEFTESRALPGMRWRLTNTMLGRPVALHRRYLVLAGPPPVRVDILGVEPDTVIDAEESRQYPRFETGFAPYATSLAEVAVRHLDITPSQLAADWRKRQSPQAEHTKRADSIFAPCNLLDDAQDGTRSLVFTSDHFGPFMPVFANAGLEGNGHSWDRLVVVALEETHSEVLDHVTFDSEADMFVARSADLGALKTIAALIRKLTKSPRTLASGLKKYGAVRLRD